MSAGKVPPKPPVLPVLGSVRGRFRLELDTRSGEGTADPFTALEDSGRLARLLLGAIRGPEGPARTLALKIQKAALAAGGDPVTNAQIDDLWKRERENLRALQGEAGPAFVDLGDDDFRHAPLVFCRATSLTFHPPCPRCLGPLRDCRDDALLRDAGLPEYSTSTSRYLHCGCAGAPKVFYTAAPTSDERPRPDVVVRRRGELYRDLAKAVRSGTGDAEAFPCLSCPRREECYPAAASEQPIPAEARLAPVSFYDFHLLPLEPIELTFDEASDLVGGADWADVRARGVAGRERLDAAFDGPFQWLYRGDTFGRFALEVLYLKLSLFQQAAVELRAFHRRCRQPHLDLSAKTIGVSAPVPGSAAPARWGFRARLASVTGPRRLFPAASAPEAARELWAPPPDADKAHVSPFVREAAPGQAENLRVALRERTAEGTARGLILPDRARIDHWRPRDVVRLVPSSGAGPLDGLTLWGVLEARDDKGFAFAAELPAGAGGQALEFPASVAHYPRFQPPCDLYGLGLLFLRALAANDENDAFAVDDAALRVLKKLGVALEGKGAPSARRAAVELAMLLDEEKAVFGSAALLRRREDRTRKENAIPARLWADVLLFAFKLVTRTPGFSYAVDHADAPPDRPEAPMETVVADLRALRARVSVELFGREQRDAEIHEACAELLGKLAGAGGA